MSNHRKAHDELPECSAHVECAVPTSEQKVTCLVDRITCTDSTLQESLVFVRTNTNSVREHFEAMSSSLVQVDPCRRSSRSSRANANVSSVAFNYGRRSSEIDFR